MCVPPIDEQGFLIVVRSVLVMYLRGLVKRIYQYRDEQI